MKEHKNMEMKMENQLRDQLTSATTDFFLFLEAGEIGKWIDLWAEDGIDKKPYASGMFPKEVVGKKAIYEVWSGVTKIFDSMSFPIHEFIVDEKNRTVVVRSDGKGFMKNGNLYENTYIFLFHFDQNNKIKECYEYFNPYIAGENFGVVDNLKY